MNKYEEKARALFLEGYNCAQAVTAAFAEEIGMDELAVEDTIRISLGEDAAAESILLLPDESRDFC